MSRPDLRHRKSVNRDPLSELTKKKTFWRGRSSESYSFYCPSCRAERKVPYRSRPGGWRQVVRILSLSAFFTLVTWPWFEWKGVVSIVPFWTAYEIFYRTRMRASLSCTHCGFDPFLYLTDVKKAREEIEKHWRAKFAERGIPFPDAGAPSETPASKESSTPLTAGDPER